MEAPKCKCGELMELVSDKPTRKGRVVVWACLICCEGDNYTASVGVKEERVKADG